MEKIIGIKLGEHARFENRENKVYYYKALEDFKVGDIAIVILPDGRHIGVPVVSVHETENGMVGEVSPHKYAVGKLDKSKFKKMRVEEKLLKEEIKSLKSCACQINSKIKNAAIAMGWSFWEFSTEDISKLILEYNKHKLNIANIVGQERSDEIDGQARKEDLSLKQY